MGVEVIKPRNYNNEIEDILEEINRRILELEDKNRTSEDLRWFMGNPINVADYKVNEKTIEFLKQLEKEIKGENFYQNGWR